MKRNKVLYYAWFSIIAFVTLAFIIKTINNEICDVFNCKFSIGEDVKIKHKWRHDEAVITNVDCDCIYTIKYYSYYGVQRERIVSEYELEKN